MAKNLTLGNFFDNFEAEYLEIANFSGFIRIERQI